MPPINPVLVNLSKTQRPDGLCLDFRVSFSQGPIARGDASQGNIARVWKTRVDSSNNVWLARENDAHNGWDAEVLVFNFVGVAATELDLAFDQNANIVVCLNRPTGVAGAEEVWLYYFDSLSSAFVFQNFGEGRSAKLILDDALGSTSSDVLLFYMKDSINKLCVRVQRERYLVENQVLLGGGVYVNAVNSFVDDVYRVAEGRVHVLIGVHDVATGHYTYQHYETTLYPHISENETFKLGLGLAPGSSMVVVVINNTAENESAQIAFALLSGDIHETLIQVPGTLYFQPEEDWKAGLALQSGILAIPIILVPGTAYQQPEEDWRVGLAAQSGTLVAVVITHTTYDVENWKTGLDLQSGTLV